MDELNRAAAALARAEADAAPGPVVVGGSMGPTGEMLEPYGELSFDDASAAFEAQAAALVAGGVDVLWIETMADLEEVRAAAEGAHRAAPDTPVVMTMTFDTPGRTMIGVSPEKAITALREHGVIALGANCGNGPAEIEGVIEQMRAVDATVPLVAKANAGLPHMKGTGRSTTPRGDHGPVRGPRARSGRADYRGLLRQHPGAHRRDRRRAARLTGARHGAGASREIESC